MNAPDLSVVIPCHNEEHNLAPLISAIHAAMAPLAFEYEIIITDDCSSDHSWEVLKRLAAEDSRLRIQRFTFNCGESAATWAGVQAGRGHVIATLDADLQNDPKDLPALIAALNHADCVCGTRLATRSRGDKWIRIASSRIANWVRNKLSGENISDAGCTYRVFTRECIANVKFFNGAHRFLPTLIKMEGFKVIEVPVSANRRFSGTSHYGVWNRLFKSFRDLLAIRWMKSRRIRYEIAETR
jgi:glycosyltransferase involved in cell wall biosynthesis